MECVLLQLVGIFKQTNIITATDLKGTKGENTSLSYCPEIAEFCLLSVKSVEELHLNSTKPGCGNS